MKEQRAESVTLTFGPNNQLRVKMLQQRMRTLVTQNWTGGLWDVSSDPDTPDALNTVTANILSVRCLLLTAGWSACTVLMFQATKHPRPWKTNTTFHFNHLPESMSEPRQSNSWVSKLQQGAGRTCRTVLVEEQLEMDCNEIWFRFGFLIISVFENLITIHIYIVFF